MSVTILEALQNADRNINNPKLASLGLILGKDQLHNAVTLLDKGYDLYDDVDPLLDEYGTVENVPENSNSK
jgi:hypothetical protein